MDPTPVPEAILCVDDEGIILLHLITLLKRRYGDRYRYERASNAAEARAAVERIEAEGARLSILISDWLMPGGSGDELVRSFHADRPGLRSILVSGKSDEVAIRSLYEEAGLAGFLSKPIGSEDLYGLIDRIESERGSGP